MILLIDNYDSFSYNLYQLIGTINPDIKVIRNDEMTPEEILESKPSHIILSPGPGRPEDAGICIDMVKKGRGKIPILGVCLGHQSICKAYGAEVGYAKQLMHGKTSQVTVTAKTKIFERLPKQFQVARYHSLAALKETMPDSLTVTAETEDKEVMAVSDEKNQVYGVQFHPESILTPLGKEIMISFLGGENK
ncbi:MAG: aminodeoxychorismate/anthranilate synthase component II [Clostridiales bacterium]|nr:aminodeoxychorismate/anthranilate synthase component II [Clostridiales bacterium]